jgi:oxygen-independent coproporphyrinogen III oxidase
VLGLYIHIPFCSAICNYCNFNRGLFDGPLKERYLAALEREIRTAPGLPAEAGSHENLSSLDSRAVDSRAVNSRDVNPRGFRLQAEGTRDAADTIFFGGGTPSLLEPAEIARIITACRDTFDLAPDAEITLETNPETSSPERMEQFRAAGVNRVSFGVQSFREPELQRLGRIHTADRARAAFTEARAAGIDNISLDLMMWLPQQSAGDWRYNVESLIEVGPDHASLYLLELYPNAPLKEDMARAGWSQAPDDDAAEMYLWSMERLEAAGYTQYEISNVARPGRDSRHNLKYWRDGEWLGFGCGAHSTRGGIRWKNVSSTEDYIRRIGDGNDVASERRSLAATERFEEALFTGLRLTEGIDTDVFAARYREDVWLRYGRDLAPFLAEGLMVREGPRLALTRRGMLLANEILQVFV